MSDDLPVPRDPDSSALLGGSPARKRSVLRARACFCRSMPVRLCQLIGSSRRMARRPERWRRQTAAAMCAQSKGVSLITLLRLVLNMPAYSLALARPEGVGSADLIRHQEQTMARIYNDNS